MSIKATVKEAGEGKGGLGIALWAALGFIVIVPAIMWIWSKIKGSMPKKSAASTTGQ